MKAFTRGERVFLSVLIITTITVVIDFSDVMKVFAAEETGVVDVYSEKVVVSKAVKEEEPDTDVIPVVVDEPEEEPELIMYYTDEDVDLLGRLITKEAGALSYEEQRAVADTVVHRLDLEQWPDTVASVITQPGQYATDLPNEASEEAKEVAYSALDQWNLIKNGYNSKEEWSLPEEYICFFGNGRHNYFYCRVDCPDCAYCLFGCHSCHCGLLSFACSVI